MSFQEVIFAVNFNEYITCLNIIMNFSCTLPSIITMLIKYCYIIFQTKCILTEKAVHKEQLSLFFIICSCDGKF